MLLLLRKWVLQTGEDCQFRHNIDTYNVTLVQNDEKLKEDNRNLKKDLEELRGKCEKTQLDLDQLMENQSKQDFVKKEYIKKEMEVYENKFNQELRNNFEIIKSQNIKISDLILQKTS